MKIAKILTEIGMIGVSPTYWKKRFLANSFLLFIFSYCKPIFLILQDFFFEKMEKNAADSAWLRSYFCLQDLNRHFERFHRVLRTLPGSGLKSN